MEKTTKLVGADQFEDGELLQASSGSDLGSQRRQVASLAPELGFLRRIVCRECSGFGHTALECPTRGQLDALGSVVAPTGRVVAITRDLVHRRYTTSL